MKAIAFAFIFLSLNHLYSNAAGCLIASKPYDVFQCITINPQMLVGLLSNGDLKSFCSTVNTYMGCIRTYVEDCVGGRVALGALDELSDLNKKCCLSTKPDLCVTKNPALLQNCFAVDNMITLANNMRKPIGDIQVGDFVKAVDSNGNIIDSEVTAIMHKETNAETNFLNFKSASGDSISLTGGHLINIKTKGYIKASTVKVGDIMNIYSSEKQNFIDSEIVKIENEIKQGYIAPLTEEGTILVNNVHASCYAEINSHWLANIVMSPMNAWYKLSKYFGYTASSSADNGLHVYATVLQQFTLKFIPSLFA